MIVCEKRTAVVILSYNSIEWHKLFLPKIIEQAASGYEVVLVDHASPDDTAEFVRTNYPSVKLICLKDNLGFAGGYAAALEQIEAKYYILLSSDFEVTNDWYPPLEAAMEKDELLGAIQPKIRYWKQREFFEYAGAAGGFMDKWGYLFCRGRFFDTLEEDNGQYDSDIEVFWASGGCLMVRADAYHECGGLDADFYAHMEEVDLCWRLQNNGYTIGAVGSSTVFHVGGSIISYGSPAKTYYNYRNNLFLLLKNERASKIWWLLPWRLVLDGVSCGLFLVKGDFRNIAAVLKAHFHFYTRFFYWFKKRKTARQNAIGNTIKGVYFGSIIVDYFVKKRKKYTDLNLVDEKL